MTELEALTAQFRALQREIRQQVDTTTENEETLREEVRALKERVDQQSLDLAEYHTFVAELRNLKDCDKLK